MPAAKSAAPSVAPVESAADAAGSTTTRTTRSPARKSSRTKPTISASPGQDPPEGTVLTAVTTPEGAAAAVVAGSTGLTLDAAAVVGKDGVAEDKDDVPMTKEEGRAWWVDEMTQRFLRGGDEDFEYAKIDHSPAYDDPEWERDLQDAWFESMESDFDSDGEGKEKILVGETGIQDY